MKSVRILAITLIFVLMISLASADRGFIIPYPFIIEEDSQVAIVAWNGSCEVLMLSTNVKASEHAEVWEVLPLPSEPLVEKGNRDAFWKISQIYGRKAIRLVPGGVFTKPRYAGTRVEVVFRKQIGVHNVTVVRADSVDDLRRWVENNLALKIPVKPFKRYTEKGYKYFVFDKIEVSREEKTVEPLIYVFETDKAYYPLVITTETTNSPSSVSLFFIARGKPLDKTPLFKDKTVFFSSDELRQVHEVLWRMFPDGAYVTYYRGNGMYTEDFVIKMFTFQQFSIWQSNG